MQKLFGQTFAHGIRSFPTQRILFCYLFSILATIYGYCRNKDKSSGNPLLSNAAQRFFVPCRFTSKKACFSLLSSWVSHVLFQLHEERYHTVHAAPVSPCHVHGIVILWQQTHSSNLTYSFQKRMHVVTQEPGGPL